MPTRRPASCCLTTPRDAFGRSTDASKNKVTCQAKVRVVDTTVPKLAAVPANITVECDAVPPRTDPTVTDACDPNTVLAFQEVRADGSCLDRYTLTRTWTATDACSNQAKATQVITVQDTRAPALAAYQRTVPWSCSGS